MILKIRLYFFVLVPKHSEIYGAADRLIDEFERDDFDWGSWKHSKFRPVDLSILIFTFFDLLFFL